LCRIFYNILEKIVASGMRIPPLPLWERAGVRGISTTQAALALCAVVSFKNANTYAFGKE
jgi:hypothetical protein